MVGPLYLNKEERHTLTTFRISSHRLEVERGRYFGLKFENRIYKLCNDHVEDEEHFMISCKNLEHIRVDYLNFITDKYPNLQFLNNELKFIWLLISEDRLIMSPVAKLLVKLFEKRYTLLNGGVCFHLFIMIYKCKLLIMFVFCFVLSLCTLIL